MHTKKILICDGDPDFSNQVIGELESKGYEIRLLPNTNGLMNVITLFKPDLILISIEGIDADNHAGVILLKLTDLTKAIPLVLLSENPRLPEMAKLLKSDGYMFKPADTDKLEAIIEDLTIPRQMVKKLRS